MLKLEFNDIKADASLIREHGFNAVQVGLLQSLKEDSYKHWWLSYQPCSFEIGNIYGSKEEFIQLSETLHENDLLVFPDVICIHVVGTNDGSLTPHEKVDSTLVNNSSFWC